MPVKTLYGDIRMKVDPGTQHDDKKKITKLLGPNGHKIYREQYKKNGEKKNKKRKKKKKKIFK